MEVIRIPPFHYIHVLDQNTNIAALHKGPLAYVLQTSEQVMLHPKPMITIPPMHYCSVTNPIRMKEGRALQDKHGQYKLAHGETEIRTENSHPEPFVLYPGEDLLQAPVLRPFVEPDHALQVQAVRDFGDKKAGDQWLVKGPATYLPMVEVQILKNVAPIIVAPNSALRIRASVQFTDRRGVKRGAGEEWLETASGVYVKDVYEELVKVEDALILTDKLALHLRCTTSSYVDVYGKERKPGQEWLVTNKMAASHILNVYEEIVQWMDVTVLNASQFCYVVNPVNANGVAQLGVRQLRKGPRTFFLLPGECLENNTITDNYILRADSALLLTAIEPFQDGKKAYKAGERWMVHGPCEYVPPVEVEVLEQRHMMPLDSDEGIYVRNIDDGKVRSVLGPQTYMLRPNEELWEKDLGEDVENLLAKQSSGNIYVPTSASASKEALRRYDSEIKVRDKTKVVSFRVPMKTAVQIYQYDFFSKESKSKVVFGPSLVMLNSDEQFTVNTLSGGRPKKPGQLKTLAVALGPDFMTDDVDVVTSDHARLRLTLAYNWQFDMNKVDDSDNFLRLFSVKDFIGDVCKTIAAEVRGHVATLTFDSFHRNSAKAVRSSVLGTVGGKVNDVKIFPSNRLLVTNVDIKSIEPVDEKTRTMLLKSVQLAIEITTKSLEASSRHEAEKLEQKARGAHEQQKIEDAARAEKARQRLLQLQAESSAVQNAGQAKSEALADAEAHKIQAESEVEMATKKVQAYKARMDAEREMKLSLKNVEIKHQEALNMLEMEKKEALANIENNKLKTTIDALGQNTLVQMSRAKADTEAKLMKCLNMKGLVVSDTHAPVDFVKAAQGFLGVGTNAAPAAEGY